MTHEAEYSISMTIDSKIMNVRLIGLSVRSLCEVTPLDDTTRGQMELCVVEAATNIIKHAYQNSDQGSIKLQVQIFPDHIVFVFQDQGIPMDESPQTYFTELDPDDISSWQDESMKMGVYLIRSIMDETVYEHRNKTNYLTMAKYFRTANEIS